MKIVPAVSLLALAAGVSPALAANPGLPAIVGVERGGCGGTTATECRANIFAAQSGDNRDITSLGTQTNTFAVAIPVGSTSRGLDIAINGFPANMQGAFKSNQIIATVNQPMAGSSTPGTPTSSTFETLRVQANVGTGWKGVEMRGIQAVVSVTGPLGTDVGMQDLVALSGSIASSSDNGIYTLYSQSNGVVCSPGCWTRAIVSGEIDSKLSSFITPLTTTYNPADSGYGGVPTVTFTLATPLPPYLIAHVTAQYFVIETATSTFPAPGVAAGSTLVNRWPGIYASPDGLTLVIGGPVIPSNQTFGTLTNVTIDHIPIRYGWSIVAQDVHNAGNEAALRVAGPWWWGLLFEKTYVGGPTDTHGALLKGFNTFSAASFAEFTGDIFKNVLAFDGNTLTGVDWAKSIFTSSFTGLPVGPTIPSSSLTVGAATIYGHSVAAPTDNPLPANLRLPFVEHVSYPTDPSPAIPIRFGADFDEPGENACPAETAGHCEVAYQGATRYDLQWFGPAGVVPNATCNAGTTLWATAAAGATVTLTTDGGAPNAGNIVNLTSGGRSEAGSVDILVQLQGGDQSESWINWPLMLIRKIAGSKTLTKGTTPTPLDPSTMGAAVAMAFDSLYSGIDLNVTMPATAGTYTATACFRLAKAY